MYILRLQNENNNIVESVKPSLALSICIVIVVAATFLLFSGTIGHEFINFDDDIYVYDNPHVKTLSSESVSWLFTHVYYTQYIPVTLISHAIDYALWKDDPKGHHFTNVLLHSFNAGWVFCLALVLIGQARRKFSTEEGNFRFMTGDPLQVFGAMAAALLFAFHPLRVESVAWISDRKDLLCLFFLIPSFLSYLLYASLRSVGKGKRWLTLTFVLFVLAVLSKSVAVGGLVIYLLADYLLLPRQWRGQGLGILKEKIPFIIVAVIVAGVSMALAPHAKVNVIVSKLTGAEHVLFPFYCLFFYLQKIIAPVNLAPMYPSVSIGVMMVSVLLICSITGVCIALARKGRPVFLFAWCSFIVIQIPTIVGFSSGAQPFADRYSYVGTVGLFVLAGGGLQNLWDRLQNLLPRLGLILGTSAILVILAVLSHRQSGEWQSSEKLWRFVLRDNQRTDDYLDAYVNLGTSYVEKGRLDEGSRFLEAAIEINPRDPDAHFNLAYVYFNKGDVGKALDLFRKTIALDSLYAKAYYNIGIIESRNGNEAAAMESLRQAAQLGSADAQELLSKNNVAW